MKNLLKDRKMGFYLTALAAVIALAGAICYLVLYQGTKDPVTGTIDRVFNWLTFGTILGGAVVSCLGESVRLRFVPIVAAALYSVGLANHLTETAYPLADVLTKVPFFGGNPNLAITFAVIFGVAAVLQVIASFMEHNNVNAE